MYAILLAQLSMRQTVLSFSDGTFGMMLPWTYCNLIVNESR
jgi:hypothetical protein